MEINDATVKTFELTFTFILGDGTSQLICFIGELLKQADGHIADGVHPRLINDGFRLASVEAKKALDIIAQKKEINRDLLLQVQFISKNGKLTLLGRANKSPNKTRCRAF